MLRKHQQNHKSPNPQEQKHDSDEDISTSGKEIVSKYAIARGKPDNK